MVPKNVDVAWYWKRLKRVPLAEFPYRISHIAKKSRDRVRARASVAEQCEIDSVIIHRIDVSALGRFDPRIADVAREAGERIANHQFEIFGLDVDFGPEINWHLDPKTMRSWPPTFWGDINYRDGQTIGGIKFAWELNRLHHLPQLAIATAMTGDTKYEREIFTQLRSWMESNPYPHGINWISGIELGIRVVNLVYALKILPGPMTQDDHELVCEFIYRHATHLFRYPSKYTSGANHAVAEALGLFVAGVSFPGFSASSKWKRFGKQVLDREVSRQIYPDGSSFEHSFPYLQFVVDHFLTYFLMCKDHGETCSDAVPDRLRAAFRFVGSMLDDNGNYAAIGDDDSGYLMKLWFGTHNNFLSLLKTGELLFSDGTLAKDGTTPDLKNLLLLGPDTGLDNSAMNLPGKPPDQVCDFFDNAGLAVIRVRDPVDILFVGNSGPLGLKPLAAHGHADALSFWLSVNGQPVFVDPGTYLYHSGGIWRDYFRSTAAHNTVRVDATDQAEIISDFMFGTDFAILDADLAQQGRHFTWKATHDGYRRLADPVLHQRMVTLDSGEARLSVRDTVACADHHVVELFFHLHPDCDVVIEGRRVRIDNGSSRITMRVDDSWSEIDAIKGGENGRGGWYSHEFNVLQETVVLRLRTEISGDATFVTVIDCATE